MPEPGLRASVAETVTEDLTAERVGSGDVAVYATPMVLALVERAAVAALEGALEPGQTSVGARVELDHLAPTPPGVRVEATATLEEVDGHRLRFSVSVLDPAGEVARGTHVRAIVDRGPFLEAASTRTG
jgi:predicted thioesterase